MSFGGDVLGGTPMAAADRDSLYRVAYDEAVRALSEQQGAIDSLQSRAGLLLSAAAINTSIFSARALDSGDPNLATWLAMANFVAVAVVSLAILWPHRWTFTADPGDLVRAYVETGESAPMEGLYRELSLHMRNSYAKNLNGIGRLAALFQTASALFTLEVILWIVAVATAL